MSDYKRYLRGRALKASNMLKEFYDPHGIEDSMRDAMADMMHLAQRKDIDFSQVYDKACETHNAEMQHGEG